uniref:Mannose binding tuber lectin n=1 Tax=Amorphophallus paeoniifolius var. campanulatus TaxID=203634 RepID=W0D443_AMOPO|nr:mannose binding tuber lectin [Amorphophallus paeoniifolius var. campanulatus]
MEAKPASLAFFLLFLLGVALRPSEAAQALYAPAALFSGQSLTNGNYVFTMQADCNLVLYDRGRAIWASGTARRASNCVLRMQRDGNLVVYTPGGSAIWASGTNRGAGNYILILQSDRNVVIYGPDGRAIWATNTKA